MSDHPHPIEPARIRPRLSVLHVLAAVLGVMAVALAWQGDWTGFAKLFFLFTLLAQLSLAPLVTISGGEFRYRALHGSFSVKAADVAGVTPVYAFKAPDPQPLALNVDVRGQSRTRAVSLGRFSGQDVRRILAFFAHARSDTSGLLEG